MNKPVDEFKNQADEQLLDALLKTKYKGESEGEESNAAHIERALQAIENLERPRLLAGFWPLRFKTYSAIGGIAASLILSIVFVVSLTSIPSHTAMAEINKVIDQIEQLGDRVYRIKIENVKSRKNAKPSLRRGDEEIHKVKPRFERAKLYLRGNNQFVLVEQSDGGTGFIKGSDGTQSWQINGDARGLTTGDVGDIKLPLASKSRTLVFTDLAGSLAQLREGYDISLFKNQTLAKQEGSWTKIVAEKTDSTTKGVKRVTLYFDPDSYSLQRLIFNGIHFPGDQARMRIVMDLKSTQALPQDYFHYSYHHTGEAH